MPHMYLCESFTARTRCQLPLQVEHLRKLDQVHQLYLGVSPGTSLSWPASSDCPKPYTCGGEGGAVGVARPAFSIP
jgi:hypothetical protein